MDITTLLADPAAIELESFVSEVTTITVVVRSIQPRPRCPTCQHVSESFHSHYTRTVADLPWHGVAIRLKLHTRKFRCRNQQCPQKVFCERLPQVVAAYARQTVRLNAALIVLAFALGGKPGARTTRRLNLTVSGDTLLRRIRRWAQPEVSTPRALGVDDWAKRKGYSYGTLLVDLERRCPIDVLPDREAETVAQWLKAHPGIEVVARDRASSYADGITAGAPSALQVADRWHLLKNLSGVLERLLNRHRLVLREAAPQLNPYRSVSESLNTQSLPELHPKREWSRRSATDLVQQQARRGRRVERYEEVKRLHAAGATISAIARTMGMHRSTVRQFLRADEYPEARPPIKPSKVQPFADYLKERWLSGCHNACQLFREIRARGYI